MSAVDVVVIGSGPNGLTAAIEIARSGAQVLVVEARNTIGGGMRTEELTLDGFHHDVCSAAHPMGILSPYLRTLPLQEHGLTWAAGTTSFAHPMIDAPALLAHRSLDECAAQFGSDEASYRELLEPFLRHPEDFLADVLGPLRIPRRPFTMLRFGLVGLRSAVGLARARFSDPRTRAFLAGCAAHSILPLDRMLTGAVGMIFCLTAHMREWPVAVGGSQSIARALANYLVSLGGKIETSRPISDLSDLPPARAYIFDTSPRALSTIAAKMLPSLYLKRLSRYRYGPAAFKVDWALDGPIPWTDERCREASTVHVGGTIEEIAASEAAGWRGEVPDKPFLIVVQGSELDATRAPEGKHTGYAYCHVPASCEVDMTDAIENQVERFAPGFKDRVLARHKLSPSALADRNPNYVGGAITGGVSDLFQLFTRPIVRIDPYSTPNPRLYLCSAATPPGGGVHGMGGFFAAKSVLRRLHQLPTTPLA